MRLETSAGDFARSEEVSAELWRAFGLTESATSRSAVSDRSCPSAVAVTLRRLLPPEEGQHTGGRTLAEIIDVVVHHRHAHIRSVVEFIDVALDEAEAAHPENGHLQRLHHCFDALASELFVHFEKEEHVVFPALLEGRGPLIARSIRYVMHEHDVILDLVGKVIRAAEAGCASDALRVVRAALDLLGHELETAVATEQEFILGRAQS